MRPISYFFFVLTLAMLSCGQKESGKTTQPLNILFVIADDQSFPHAGAYGMNVFKTPAFDRVAKSGVLFTKAFVAAPQCSPSRAAILTGRNIWQLEEAGTHSSYFPKKFPVFTDALEASGYFIGYTGKPWAPGNWKDAGWTRNPVGPEYNSHRYEHVPYTGLGKINYAENFKSFLVDVPESKPFFFWYGANEPHREYEFGSGRLAGLDSGEVDVPGFLPSEDSIRADFLDYALEISWFDQHLTKMMDMLAMSGRLENTVIVVTADNGMPFPNAKANLREYGIHVPLAICGPVVSGANRTVDDLVSLIDLAPTFLELAHIPNVEGMSGKSILPLLESSGSGIIDTTRSFILAGRERHTHARPDNLGYPGRAIHTQKYLYIKNFKADRWPMGDPPPASEDQDLLSSDLKPIVNGYEDVDDSPSKLMLLHGKQKWPALFTVSFDKRPSEELYDTEQDPLCMHNLAADPAFAVIVTGLRQQLETKLTSERDPRMIGAGDLYESYPRFGVMRAFEGFNLRGEYNQKVKPKK